MYGIGMQELLVLLLVAVVVFGSKKLPEIGRSLGKAISNFKRAGSEADEINISGNTDETGKSDRHPH
ncbi:MAG: twin-arginine translocase TatA/TatE family subunit [Desulfovibrionaceae bacterium]|nr:twin-arginine translocase TatA/TatE family subunit [Desulfovibrionaceae bacterium]